MMVHHQRYFHHLKKPEASIGGGGGGFKRAKPRLIFLLFLSLASFALAWVYPPFSLLLLYSPPPADHHQQQEALAPASPLCSSPSNGSICCDRSSYRTDICFMKGDVRTNSASSSIFLYAPNSSPQIERIRPYTRKWETSVMNTIDELRLVAQDSALPRKCDVRHDVPAVFFSTGGYTGNVYHEFNDGLIPLYITSQHLNKKVVFVILDFHTWWLTKYSNILSHLSDYPPVDFNRDKRTHCFPDATVGLRIHDELTVDSQSTPNNTTILDFRNLLDRAYRPQISPVIPQSRPKLVIISRNGSRSITNERSLVKLAEQIGFRVKVLTPDRTTELSKIYRELNSSDVMIGVHGAAMTHFLFMRPGKVFIQVVPLGTEWAASTYYGEPSVKLGLKYIGYKIAARESSLHREYKEDDPVLKDPKSVVKKGWEYTKKIYLDKQTVEINLKRFKKRLVRAYEYVAKPSLQGKVASQ